MTTLALDKFTPTRSLDDLATSWLGAYSPIVLARQLAGRLVHIVRALARRQAHVVVRAPPTRDARPGAALGRRAGQTLVGQAQRRRELSPVEARGGVVAGDEGGAPHVGAEDGVPRVELLPAIGEADRGVVGEAGLRVLEVDAFVFVAAARGESSFAADALADEEVQAGLAP